MASIQLHGATIQLPDPLVMESGEKVTSVQQWREKRRPELLELFRKNVYGRAPIGRPQNLKFEVIDTQANAMGGAATRKQVDISFAGEGGQGVIHLLLFIPNNLKKPAPCFVLINNRGARNADPTRENKSPFWPAEEIVARGYATAVFQNSDLDPDKDDGFKDGVHGIFDPKDKPRSGDAWGTIAAWAWGASRVMDYLETDTGIDAKRVAVLGHSRGGKTALWTGAQDERFALVISNDSGSTGAALARGRGPGGEDIARINKVFPHWFNQNYKAYNGKETELPVDQHELLALIAPRPVYVASASQDDNADPQAEFASCVAASPVYRLFGQQGMETDIWPKPETPLQKGSIGYHLRTGEHDLTPYDWQRFMDFADKHMR